MSVALIVINFKNRNLLYEYLRSVARQTYKLSEVIVLQYGLPDEKTLAFRKKIPMLKILTKLHDNGVDEGYNYAASFAKSKYLIFQSDDILLDKNCVKSLVELIESNKKIGIASSTYVKRLDFQKHKKLIVENAGADVDIFGFNWPKYNNQLLKHIPEIEDVFAVYGSSMMIKHSLFNEVGCFDAKYFALNDDIDLSWRVRLLGYQVFCTRKSFVYHRAHATLNHSQSRSRKRYWSERNGLRTLLKNYSLRSLAIYLPGYLCLLIMEWFYYILTMRWNLAFSLVKSIYWNVLNITDTLKKRKEVQKIRKIPDLLIIKIMHQKSFKFKFSAWAYAKERFSK